MANPLVQQGTLNKIRGSVAVLDFPELNVTAPYLGKDGISLALEGDASAYIGTMTGAVPSPEPYQLVTVTCHLLKTQSFGDLWKAQQEDNVLIGDVVVTPDASTLSPYQLSNCTIKGVAELNFAGANPDYVVSILGTYQVNGSLFDLQ